VKKMPLGKLSKSQLQKGFENLEEIEEVLNSGSRSGLAQLSSDFYTLIPHSFGRKVPPVIDTSEKLRQKLDMLMVLGDIEVAQRLTEGEAKKEKSSSKKTDTIKNPMDANYDLLKCDVEPVKPGSKEFKTLETYLRSTEGSYQKLGIVDIFKINRHSEGARHKVHDKIKHRKLLWHGTNVAVIVAILSGGLRIMPHSGGRVGKGIYFASENSKSAGYVSCAGDQGIMLLNEVALGKEHEITSDDSSLVAAPSGYDSIVARGHTEPDPKKDTSIDIDGNDVVVPQGKAIPMSKYSHSSFSQSEYLVYKESQCRIRYLLRLKFG